MRMRNNDQRGFEADVTLNVKRRWRPFSTVCHASQRTLHVNRVCDTKLLRATIISSGQSRYIAIEASSAYTVASCLTRRGNCYRPRDDIIWKIRIETKRFLRKYAITEETFYSDKHRTETKIRFATDIEIKIYSLFCLLIKLISDQTYYWIRPYTSHNYIRGSARR